MPDVLLDINCGAASSHYALIPAATVVATGPRTEAVFGNGSGRLKITNVQDRDTIDVDFRHPAFHVRFTLDAIADTTGAVFLAMRAQQPRVQLTSQTATPTNTHATLNFKLPFVDVTRAINLSPATLNGVKLRVYEHVAAPPFMPKVWCVAVPPEAAASGRIRHNMLVFFRPEMDAFHDARDAAIGGTFLFYVADPADPSKPKFDVSGGNSWAMQRGWARALAGAAAANKPVVMAYVLPPPVAQGTIIGKDQLVFWPKATSTFKLRDFVIDLVAALSDDAVVSEGSRAVGRVGVGCFSQSSDFAFDLAGTHARDIDEFIMFDPAHADWGNVVSWFSGGGGRQLHLVGGVFHDQMLKLSATSKVPSSLDHWLVAAEYKAAHFIDTLDDELAEPGMTTKYSTDTGITFASGAAQWSGNTKSGNGCTRTEMRGMLFIKNGVQSSPPANATEFNRWVSTAITREKPEFNLDRFKSLRHQWSVAGGLRNRSGAFERFLQLVLSRGNWP